MEALLATLLVLLLMGAALLVLARGWPRSSRLGGYRARTHGDDGGPGSPADQEQGKADREDDDARWKWQ